jgi:hypothetical protein
METKKPMTKSEKEIIDEVKRVFPEAGEGLIRKVIFETKKKCAESLEQCYGQHLYTEPGFKYLITLSEAKEKVINT